MYSLHLGLTSLLQWLQCSAGTGLLSLLGLLSNECLLYLSVVYIIYILWVLADWFIYYLNLIC